MIIEKEKDVGGAPVGNGAGAAMRKEAGEHTHAAINPGKRKEARGTVIVGHRLLLSAVVGGHGKFSFSFSFSFSSREKPFISFQRACMLDMHSSKSS